MTKSDAQQIVDTLAKKHARQFLTIDPVVTPSDYPGHVYAICWDDPKHPIYLSVSIPLQHTDSEISADFERGLEIIDKELQCHPITSTQTILRM